MRDNVRVKRKAWFLCIVAFLLSILCVRSLCEVDTTEYEHSQFHPAVSEAYVAWEENLHIGVRNLSTGEETVIIPKKGSNPQEINSQLPSIYGDIVVYQDNRRGDWDIYVYDVDKKNEFLMPTSKGNQLAPVIYGRQVVYQCNGNGNWDIYGFLLPESLPDSSNDSLPRREFAISAAAGDQQSPAFCDNIVVWEDKRNGSWDIYGYDMCKSREFPITKGPSDQRFPAVFESQQGEYLVVWMDYRNGNWDIYGSRLEWDEKNDCYLYDEEKIFPITTNQNNQRSPAICGDYVVWCDDRNRYTNEDEVDWDIIGYNLETNQEFLITMDPCEQRSPSICENGSGGYTVAWMEYGKCKGCSECNWNVCYCEISQALESCEAARDCCHCPYRVSRHLFFGIPLSLAALILFIFGIASRYPTIPRNLNLHEGTKDHQVHRVNPLKDPLSSFLLGRPKVFLAILVILFFSLILLSRFHKTFMTIDINALPREKAPFLYEELVPTPSRKEPLLFLAFLIPAIVFYPAREFFSYVPRVFQVLYRNGIISEKGVTSQKVLIHFNESLKEFEKNLNKWYMYVIACVVVLLGILFTFRRFPEGIRYVNWISLNFFPGTYFLFSVIDLSIFFIFGILLWKMSCVVYFLWLLNKKYDLKLNPYDTDGMGGFGPLEKLWLKMSYMVLPVLMIPVILFLLHQYSGTDFNPFSTSLICSFVSVGLLVVPILNFYHIVESGKTSRLEEVEVKIRECQNKIEESLHGDKDVEESSMKQMELCEKIVLRIKSVPPLLFKKYKKAYFFLSAIIPWIPEIISYLT